MLFTKGTFIQTTDNVTGHTFTDHLRKDINIKDHEVELWIEEKDYDQYQIRQTSTFLTVHK